MQLSAAEIPALLARIDAHSIPEPNSGCQLWIGGSRNSYGHGHMGVKGRTIMAHRVMWMCRHEGIPDGMLVLHKCDTPGCVNPNHLFLGTHQDNQADKVRKGRQARGAKLSHPRARGERAPKAKLTAEQVTAIRASVLPQRQLAALYGVSQAAISKIKRKEHWAHV